MRSGDLDVPGDERVHLIDRALTAAATGQAAITLAADATVAILARTDGVGRGVRDAFHRRSRGGEPHG
jgi:hypothetical protein